MTTKEKIDQALGISGSKSIDDMLADLNVETDEFHKTFDDMDNAICAEFKKIDEKAAELQRGESNGVLTLRDMDTSLKEIEGILAQSKQVFTHIVENITSSDLIDSELVHAAGAIIESIHLNIAEFISIYKQKVKFVEKVKLMILQQQQRIELAEIKHRQNLELIAAKKKETESVDAQEGEFEFDTDKIVKSMSRSGAFDFVGTKQETVRFEDGDVSDEIKVDDDEEDDDENEDEDGKPKKRRHG